MAMQFDVPDPIEQEIRKLRRECAKYREQRNDLRAALAEVRAEMEAMKAAAE
jgi:hypothetical protein